MLGLQSKSSTVFGLVRPCFRKYSRAAPSSTTIRVRRPSSKFECLLPLYPRSCCIRGRDAVSELNHNNYCAATLCALHTTASCCAGSDFAANKKNCTACCHTACCHIYVDDLTKTTTVSILLRSTHICDRPTCRIRRSEDKLSASRCSSSAQIATGFPNVSS